MEIERKFLVGTCPIDLSTCFSYEIEQCYLCRKPTVRIRKGKGKYTLTYKGDGMLAREEYNLPLSAEAYETLFQKHDGIVIKKVRTEIPYGKYLIELDDFTSPHPLLMAEVEFPSIEEAMSFEKPDWFLEEVTENPAYTNASMAYDN